MTTLAAICAVLRIIGDAIVTAMACVALALFIGVMARTEKKQREMEDKSNGKGV